MSRTFRPLIPTGLCSVVCIYTILSGAFSLYTAALICTLITAALSLLVLFTSGKVGAVFLAVISILCCIGTVFGFCNEEKRAIDFINKYSTQNSTVFHGRILSSKNYSSYTQADIVITEIDGKTPAHPYKCRIGFYSGESLEEGDNVVFKGTPQYPSNTDDNTFDTVSYLRSRRIFTVFPSADIISSHAASKLSFTQKTRQYAQKVVYSFLPPDSGDIAYTMISGDKYFLENDIKDSFTKSGIIHILCVSGMHFSILMGAIYGFLKVLGIRKQLKLCLMILFCVFYLAVTGFPVSAVRACIICVISYCASLTGKGADGYSSLFAAVILICLISPESVLDISAQLSFFATLGIITIDERFAFVPKKPSFVRNFLSNTANLLLSNIGAVVFTFAISSASFGSMSVVGIIATAAVSIACQVLLTALLLLIVISPVPFLLPLQVLAGDVCSLCVRYIVKCADFFSGFRFSYIDTTLSHITLFIFIAAAVVCVFFIYFGKKRAVTTTVFCILMLCFTVTVSSLAGAIIRDNRYSISYFRQNAENRQLTVKLGSQGYLIINADSEVCTNPSKAEFDTVGGNNYLLFIPDSSTVLPSVLAENTYIFDRLYGVRRVFVPKIKQSKEIIKALEKKGIEAYFIDSVLDFGSFKLNFDFLEDGVFICANDGITKSEILFSRQYSPLFYSEDCSIAAFFTRKTSNQFSLHNDVLPHADIFFTRLGKGEIHDTIHNTYGERSFFIKE